MTDFKFRNYQADLFLRTVNSLAVHKKTLMQLPTGGGKTQIFSEIIRRCMMKGYSTLSLVHREELLRQSYNTLRDHHNVDSGIIWSGVEPNYRMKSQIAMVQSVRNRPLPEDTKLIIIDEAHHATAKTYRDILNRLPDAMVLGVTATPWRLNGDGLGDIFNDIQLGPQIKDLEDMGWIVPAKIKVYPLRKGLLDKVKITAGDYNRKQLALAMNIQDVNDEIVAANLLHAKDLQTIIYVSSLDQCEALTRRFNSIGEKAVELKSAKNKREKAQRPKIIEDFKRRKFRILVNVGTATEGTDIKGVECVQNARPSRSLTLYLQTCGRGCRIAEGKDHYVFIDHGDLVATHGLPNKPRNWTLKGNTRSKYKSSVPRAFKIRDKYGNEEVINAGFAFKAKKGFEIISEYKPENENRQFDLLLHTARKRGHKPASAFYKFCEWLNDQHDRKPNAQEIVYMARKMKWSTRWIEQKI